MPVGVAVIALTPILMRESRAALSHRHFDLAGAGSITAGLMLLVYAMTRAAQHGWATAESIVLLAASAGLIATFFVIESRSPAPLLPLRIFRLRTLSGSNVAGILMGAAIFAQFFLLTLYMQEVLHYSRAAHRPRLHRADADDHRLLGARAGARDARRRATRAPGGPRALGGRARAATRGCRSTAATSPTSSRRS